MTPTIDEYIKLYMKPTIDEYIQNVHKHQNERIYIKYS